MAEHSSIEWTDATWNPVTGCTVMSPGCTNCYAMKLAGTRLQHHPSRAGLTVDTKAGPVWNGQVRLNEQWLDQPLRWTRPRMIFVCAHGDLFHEDVPDEWIDRVFAVMALSPQHTFQVLTKRSARMREYVNGIKSNIPFLGRMPLERIHLEAAAHMEGDGGFMDVLKERGNVYSLYLDAPWPLPNLWLGVSAEDQMRADERIPDLLATPAAIRFVSAEPLLGPIDLERVGTLDSVRMALPDVIAREDRGRPKSGAGSISGAQIDALGSAGSSLTFFQTPDHMGGFTAASPRQWPSLDWVIVGGESGKGARPMHPAWARQIRDQCDAAGVPFFFKQWGSWVSIYDRDRDDPDWRNVPKPGDWHRKRWLNLAGGQGFHGAELNMMRNVGKKAAGRLLDGIEHNGMPQIGEVPAL